MQDGVVALSKDNVTVTKTDGDDDYSNCVITESVMEEGSGTHTISLKFGGPEEDGSSIIFGIVQDGVLCDEDPVAFREETTTAWMMDGTTGCLIGNNKREEGAGEIGAGQILTMQVDLDAGTLKFWLDGTPHGAG